KYGAASRRADVDAREHVLSDQKLLAGVRHLGSNVIQLSRDILVELEPGLLHLELGFFHSLGEAGDVALGNGEIAFDALLIALKFEIFVAGIVALFDQRSDRGYLGLVTRHLSGKRFPLPLASLDVRLLLRDLGGEDAEVAVQLVPMLLEHPLLILDRQIGLFDVAARQQIGGEVDLVSLVLLGDQARLLREARVDLLTEKVEIGLGGGWLQAEEHVALFYLLRVMHQNLADDAAFEMLNRLVVALDCDLSLRDGSAIEGCKTCPDAKAAEYEGDRCEAQTSITAVVGGTGRHRL